jgi:hypothetical protein
MVSDVKASRRGRYAALTCEAVLDAAKTLSVSDAFDATYARPVPIEATVEIFQHVLQRRLVHHRRGRPRHSFT